MSCEVPECLKDATNICESCSDSKYLCTDHSINHVNIYQSHSILFLNKEQLFALHIRSLKQDIKKCIIQITEQTDSIISVLKRISMESIKKLKEANSNMSQILKFQSFSFDNKRISFLIEQAGLLATDMEESLKIERKKNSSIQEMKETISTLFQELFVAKLRINELEESSKELLFQKQEAIDELHKELEEKNKEISLLSKELKQQKNQGVTEEYKENERKQKQIKGRFKQSFN